MSLSHRSKKGFTLIELLVVIAIIGILAAMLIPIIANAKAKARQTTCVSNQRQIAMAITMYAHDHDVFPSTDWYGALDIPGGPKGILVCPDDTRDRQRTSYGMNSYLHALRIDTVQRPQVVVLTCDADETSTFAANHRRHRGFAAYSYVDGHVELIKDPRKCGRFAAGIFPLHPRLVMNDKIVDNVPPDGLISYAANTAIADQFLFSGPYGGDDASNGVQTPVGLLQFDYIKGIREFAHLTADDIPIPGETAPEFQDIKLYPGDPAGTKLANHWRYPTPTTWTKAGVEESCVRLEKPGNYNASLPKRTTYGFTFIYADQTYKGAHFNVLMDDVGEVWLNGVKVFTDPTAGDPKDEVNQFTYDLPAGISFLIVRCTNWTDGGAKFNIKIDKPVQVMGNI